MILYPDHAHAFIGVTYLPSVDSPIAVYNRDAILKALVDQGVTWLAAEDWVSYNIEGFHLGDTTPILVEFIDIEEAEERADDTL